MVVYVWYLVLKLKGCIEGFAVNLIKVWYWNYISLTSWSWCCFVLHISERWTELWVAVPLSSPQNIWLPLHHSSLRCWERQCVCVSFGWSSCNELTSYKCLVPCVHWCSEFMSSYKSKSMSAVIPRLLVIRQVDSDTVVLLTSRKWKHPNCLWRKLHVEKKLAAIHPVWWFNWCLHVWSAVPHFLGRKSGNNLCKVWMGIVWWWWFIGFDPLHVCTGFVLFNDWTLLDLMTWFWHHALNCFADHVVGTMRRRLAYCMKTWPQWNQMMDLKMS